MDQNHLSENHLVLWQNLEAAYGDYIAARAQLFKEASDSLVELVNRALKTNHGLNRSLAFEIAERLPIEKRISLIDSLLALVGWDKTYPAARDLILLLPHDWLVAHIETHAEPVLSNATYEDYAGLLEIYNALDKSLRQRLARRAAQSDDFEVREIGESWLTDQENQED